MTEDPIAIEDASKVGLVIKSIVTIAIVGASYLGGELRGAVGADERVAETESGLVRPTVVIHLSGVITDLEGQLRDAERRASDCRPADDGG